MSDQKDSKPPLPFRGGANVPIVGKLVEIDGIVLNVNFTCKCEDPKPLVLSLVNVPAAGQGAVNMRCPACKRTWAFGRDTKIHVNIAQVVTPPDGASQN